MTSTVERRRVQNRINQRAYSEFLAFCDYQERGLGLMHLARLQENENRMKENIVNQACLK